MVIVVQNDECRHSSCIARGCAPSAQCSDAGGRPHRTRNLRDPLEVLEVNPVIVSPDGCVAVDALVVLAAS